MINYYIILFVECIYIDSQRKLTLTNSELVLFGYNLLALLHIIISDANITSNDIWTWVGVGISRLYVFTSRRVVLYSFGV
jgi:hypothetical protein